MRHVLRTVLALGLLMVVSAPAMADWDEGDDYKMHWPQLPDPEGLDVNFTFPKTLADDWQCTETAPVSDVHFWYSWQGDFQDEIISIHVSVHDNIVGPPSHPGPELWGRDFDPSQFTTRPYGEGPQGWYDPNTELYEPADHILFWQANITDIIDPFIQEEGNIYWLDLSVETAAGGMAGWKTTLPELRFMDDAVWADGPDPDPASWIPLTYPFGHPLETETLDLAFVIPEPGTFVLLGTGVVGLLFCLWRRRRRR